MENEIKVNVSSPGVHTIELKPYETKKIYEGNVRNYKANSMQSVVDLVKEKGSIPATVIAYDTDDISRACVQVIFDDTVQDNKLDKAQYDFQYSEDLKDWEDIFGKRLNQKELVDFLRRRDEDEVCHIDDLIAQIQKLKLMTTIMGDYQYDDDGNVSVMYKETGGEEKYF